MKKCFVVFLLMFSSFVGAQDKVIAFDFNGVIIEVDRTPIAHYLLNAFSMSESELDVAFKAVRQARTEGISEKQYWESYSQERDCQLSDDWFAKYEAAKVACVLEIPGMLDLVAELKSQGYKVPLLSNVWSYHVAFLKKHGFYKAFEPVLLSCEIGFYKPDPRAYEVLLEHVDGVDCIFIDDELENCIAARELGIDAIHFQSREQLMTALRTRGICFTTN